MTEHLTGVDINGLCDVSVSNVETRVLRGGEVPSVVILQPRQNGKPLRVIAGLEAAMAVEGRGWHWPDSAQASDDQRRLRVPLQHILKALIDNEEIEAAGEKLSPTELLAAAIEPLSRPQGSESAAAGARTAVIAVPDDGRFLEEARQRLIDAAVQGGVTPTLLWRPIAALLGMESRFDARTVSKLAGRTVGVLSCMQDGVHAARLQVEVKTDDDGQCYFVPVRRDAGIVVPYRRNVLVLAEELARHSVSQDDPKAGWQLLWGSGLVLSWLLHLEADDTVVQTGNGWRLVSGKPPEYLPQLEFDDAALDQLDNFFHGIDYRLFEGPALEARSHETRLLYFLRDRVARNAPSLYFAVKDVHLAAHGCAVYQLRRARGRVTYYDHLPQLRLAVRRGTHPTFLQLIGPDARVEGGSAYEDERDLGLSVQSGTSSLNFYLLRESNAKPRHVKIELPVRIPNSVAISLRIRQQPAQGTARLTLVAAKNDSLFRPVELHWERMTAEDLTEKQILDRLREEQADVPPVQPQSCHRLLWTTPHEGAGGSMVQLLPLLISQLESMPRSTEELLQLLKKYSLLLTRRNSPARLTQGRERDWTLYRAISSEGAVPEPDDELTPELFDQFDKCLQDLDELVKSDREEQLCTAVVRFGGWCFQRCPDGIRRHLRDAASRGQVPNALVYFRAMGKIFADEESYRSFFALLERQLTGRDAEFKLNQIEGLFYLLSLRELAPLALSDHQATLVANRLLDRIDECVRARRNLSRLVNLSLKAYAGLMRYRIVRPSFMTPQDPILAEKQQLILEKLLRRSQRDNRVQIVKLTSSLIEWSQNRGVDRTILQWDDESSTEP